MADPIERYVLDEYTERPIVALAAGGNWLWKVLEPPDRTGGTSREIFRRDLRDPRKPWEYVMQVNNQPRRYYATDKYLYAFYGDPYTGKSLGKSMLWYINAEDLKWDWLLSSYADMAFFAADGEHFFWATQEGKITMHTHAKPSVIDAGRVIDSSNTILDDLAAGGGMLIKCLRVKVATGDARSHCFLDYRDPQAQWVASTPSTTFFGCVAANDARYMFTLKDSYKSIGKVFRVESPPSTQMHLLLENEESISHVTADGNALIHAGNPNGRIVKHTFKVNEWHSAYKSSSEQKILASLALLEKRVGELEKEVIELKENKGTKLDVLEKQVGELGKEVGGLKGKKGTNLDALDEQIGELKKEIVELKAKQETKDTDSSSKPGKDVDDDDNNNNDSRRRRPPGA